MIHRRTGARLGALLGVSVLAVMTGAAGCGGDDSSGTGETGIDAGTTTVQGKLECGGRTLCGELCADTTKDPANCGACGKACQAGEVCSNGACAASCAGGTSQCGASCADLQSDAENCGACGKACGAGEVCDAGQCKLGCTDGTSLCAAAGDAGATCADLKTDQANCGACGAACAPGLVCANGGCCAAGLTSCSASCVDLSSSAANCGKCGVACGANQYCKAGACANLLASCKAILAASAAATDGVYMIDPDGAGANAPFAVYCDMTTDGGGWTVLMVATNGDGNQSWRPTSDVWITETPFGDATKPENNVDAKSRAFAELPIDELLIKTPTDVEVETNTACLNNVTFLSVLQQNSSNAADCAVSCTTKTVAGPWTGDSRQDSTKLRLRCMDTNGGAVTGPGDYTISGDDNSFITTLNNGPYIDYNFGIGAGYTGGDTYADFDSSTGDSQTSSDTVQRIVLGR